MDPHVVSRGLDPTPHEGTNTLATAEQNRFLPLCRGTPHAAFLQTKRWRRTLTMPFRLAHKSRKLRRTARQQFWRHPRAQHLFYNVQPSSHLQTLLQVPPVLTKHRLVAIHMETVWMMTTQPPTLVHQLPTLVNTPLEPIVTSCSGSAKVGNGLSGYVDCRRRRLLLH